jgi:hypothetical protein
MIEMARTALITGASSGIGKEFAKQLAMQGNDLILVSRSKLRLEELADELRTLYRVEVNVIALDLSQPGAAQQVFRHTEQLAKSVDLLINNAGFGLSGAFLNHAAEDYRGQIGLNIMTLVELTHLFLTSMVERGSGSVVNLASLLSFLPFPYCSVYSATKSFVLSFTEAIHEEYRHLGIRVLAVCPGPTDTNFFQTAREVETKRKRTTTQVVATALSTLEKNKSFVIDGTSNYMVALLGRFLPRAALAKMLGSAVRKSIERKPSNLVR